MSYLEEIENEFSRLRGKQILLAPIDWNLAASWEKKGITLSVVFRAMNNVQKNFNEAKGKRADSINSLRYFEKAVETEFAEWQTSQIGKSNEVKTEMKDYECFPACAGSDDADVLEVIAAQLNKNYEIEPLRSAVAKLKGEILALLDDTKQKQLSTDEIETRLDKLRGKFEISLIVSVTDDERAQIVKAVKAEYGKFHLMPDVEQKVLIRKLYQKFHLPELTLFAF